MIRHETMVAALDHLGAMNPTRQSKEMARLRIKGKKMECGDCVVALYLFKTVAGVVWVRVSPSTKGTGCVRWGGDGAGPRRLFLPRSVNDFAVQFDLGDYPELEK